MKERNYIKGHFIFRYICGEDRGGKNQKKNNLKQVSFLRDIYEIKSKSISDYVRRMCVFSEHVYYGNLPIK